MASGNEYKEHYSGTNGEKINGNEAAPSLEMEKMTATQQSEVKRRFLLGWIA